MKTAKAILSIGLNDKDKHIQIVSESEAKKIIIDCLTNNEIEGATIYQAIGIYKSESEKSYRVEIYNNKSENKLIKAIKDIKRLLNQEAIYLEKQEVDSVEI